MNNSFLQQTARSIVERIAWKQLGHTTLVLPSHRAGLVLKDELLRLQQQSHQSAIWAPEVKTLQQLQDQLSPLYAEDELMTIVRLYKKYIALNQESSDSMPLDLFYGWGRQMIADFTNIDASMHAEEVPNFFDNTIAAHELEQWKLDSEVEERLRNLMGEPSTATDQQSIKSQYEQIWRNLYVFYQALHAEMSAEQKGYSGMRQRAVIEHWDDASVQQQIKGRTYVFVGFNYLLPVERELMEKLRDAGQAIFYWDFVPDFQTNTKAFSFAKQNSGLLGAQNSAHVILPDTPQPVSVISCVSKEAQAQYVHQWLLDNYKAKGDKVGVVICDETMLEPVIYALPAILLPETDQPVPMNITKGFPLRNTQVYAEVVNWLYDRSRGDVEQVITSDFIDELLAELFPVKELPDDNQEATHALTWQELLILESEYQVRKIANQLRKLIADGLDDVPFTLRLLRLLLRRMMESVTMPFHGEPITDIQVMGVLETRMLDFDRLLMLNVEEGVIPQKQADLSFIPYYLRKTYHMQTSDERATVYAYNFFRLLSRAGETTLLFSSAEASEGGKGMSRFIMQILASPEFIVHKYHLQESGVLTQIPLLAETHDFASLLSTLEVDTDGVVRKKDGKKYRLSPSALNTYITCPRSFYWQYVLGMRPEEKEDAMFGPNTLGSFVHHALEYIYTTFLLCDNQQPRAISPDEIEAICTDEAKKQEALTAAYAEMNRLWLKDHPEEPNHYVFEHHQAEHVIILGYVQNVLKRDREDARKGLKMYLLEQNRTFALDLEGIGTIEAGGIIDRMDVVNDGGRQVLRIVDYKSGSFNDTTHAKKMSSGWDELLQSADKGYVRQTLLYSHAVMVHDKTGLPIEPNLYFCRKDLREIPTTIVVDNQPVTDYRIIQKPFINALRSKVQELMTTTDFPQCAESDCPSFCPFFSICERKAKE